MNIQYRCSCSLEPVLAEMKDGLIYSRKKGYEIYAKPPMVLSCAECRAWYSIGDNLIMMRRKLQDVHRKCVACDRQFVTLQGGLMTFCPHCYIQQPGAMIPNKQTR